MRTLFVVGTAGHIDHGKSALVKALTGIDPDRLEEEKRRGMTIDLGFAHFDLPSGRRAGIVDLPRHERLIKNMLAGATRIDPVLLVIAADEGAVPQTREHLESLQVLPVPARCGAAASLWATRWKSCLKGNRSGSGASSHTARAWRQGLPGHGWPLTSRELRRTRSSVETYCAPRASSDQPISLTSTSSCWQ